MLCKENNCRHVVRLENYQNHLLSGCKESFISDHSSDLLTVNSILIQPSNVSPSATEEQLASNLVKRMMVNDHLTIRTGGQVY